MELKEFSKIVGTVLGYYKKRIKNLKGIIDIDNALKEIGRTQEVEIAKKLICNISLSNSNIELEDKIRRNISDIMLFDTKEMLDGNLMLGYYYKEQA